MLEEIKVRTMLQKVRAIELRTRTTMNNALAGSYHSIFKGQGVNFEEIREYTPGDEVRFIDWNTSAKLGKPFIKIFREERELTLILAIDISQSMGYGATEQSKREFATEVASVLAFSALKNNDKVGLILFAEGIEKFVPPQKGRQALLRIIREALFFKPNTKKTDFSVCIASLQKMLKKRSIVCLLSDFMPTTNAVSQASLIEGLARLNQHHDLLCLRVEDPRERAIPDVGIIALEDAETQQKIYIDTHSKKVKTLLEKNQSQRWDTFARECQRSGIDLLSLVNGQTYITALKNFFSQRQRSHL